MSTLCIPSRRAQARGWACGSSELEADARWPLGEPLLLELHERALESVVRIDHRPGALRHIVRLAQRLVLTQQQVADDDRRRARLALKAVDEHRLAALAGGFDVRAAGVERPADVLAGGIVHVDVQP
eukprot:2485337-Prymnesium_polylepis.2